MFIPDPTFFHPGFRIRIKEFKYFNPKKTKKWFRSSKKYDPGCSSRIRMLTFYQSRISDPGSRGQKGARSRIRNTVSTVPVCYGTYLSSAEEVVVEELLEVNPILGVALEQAVEQVGEEGRGTGRNARRQPAVLLVELLQRLRSLGLQFHNQSMIFR
jgi:hypothetical protein